MKTTTSRQNYARLLQLKCNECSKVLSSNAYLDRHIKTRHRKKSLEFVCDFDGMILKYRSGSF